MPAPRFIRNDLAFSRRRRLFVAGKTVHRHELGETGPGKPSPGDRGAQKKGLTRIAATLDGRWLALHKHLDVLELWHVGDPNPTKRATVRTSSLVDLGFRPDSAQLGSPAASPAAVLADDRPRAGRLEPAGDAAAASNT